MKKNFRRGILSICLGLATLSSAMAAQAEFDIMTTRPKVTAEDNTAQTKYPIVLIHGAFGPTNIGGIIEELGYTYNGYWYNMPDALARHGAEVYVASVSLSGMKRAEESLAQVQRVLDATGAEKVNIITHSQGAVDGRYIASIIPTKVASLTTIAGPHRGTRIAEIPTEDIPGLSPLVEFVTDFAGDIISALNGTYLKSESGEWLSLMTRTGMTEFNRQFPTTGLSVDACGSGQATETRSGNAQQLYSWTGNRDSILDNLNVAPFIASLDPMDWLAALASALTGVKGGQNHDSVVEVCSAKFGKELGVYNWNHFDELNLLLGSVPFGATSPNDVLYRHGVRLKQAAL